MQSFTYKITDSVGLHARPAANLARKAAELASTIQVRKEGAEREADAKSMMAVMMLGVREADTVVFTLEGATEEADAQELEAFCAAEL